MGLRLSSVELTILTSVIVLSKQKKWLSGDLHRQRCEVKARRDAKMCCKILTAFLTKRMENVEWCAIGVAEGH